MRRNSDAGEDRSIGSLLEAMLEEPVMRRGIERARLLDAFSEIAESVLGQSASAACRAVRVTDHAFVVEVSDSIWGQRIQLMSRALLAALRDAGAPSRVTRILTRPASRQLSVEATAPPSAASLAMRCERCGAMSRSGKYCLACRAEADFWNTRLG
ncbi:MAG: DciA family protein [Chloroflexi bacterium]|nr:DciA family protein [Chloroflexota bacterium]MCY3938594.1 DciA family protein [Chloroflexota bacterium]